MNKLRTTSSFIRTQILLTIIYGLKNALQISIYKSRFFIYLSLTTLLLTFGCQFNKTTASKQIGYYYLNPNKDLARMSRIALVELNNDSSYPQISVDITESLFQALQKRQIFGLTIVRQNDPAWRSLQVNLNSTYDLGQLVAIHNTLKCNAVLTGTITEFRPHPHMIIGLRLKLVDLRDGQLIWAVEQIWDTADKTIESRMKKYFQTQIRAGYASLQEQLITISSLNFIKFITYEVAATM